MRDNQDRAVRLDAQVHTGMPRRPIGGIIRIRRLSLRVKQRSDGQCASA